jgi:hypothetical protein
MVPVVGYNYSYNRTRNIKLNNMVLKIVLTTAITLELVGDISIANTDL